MTAPEKWLDAAELDRWIAAVERMEVWPATALAVAAQARAALSLRAELNGVREASATELRRAYDELAEDEALRNRMGDILTLTVNALKGEPDSRSLHDWATLPEVARAAVAELAECRAECLEQARLLGVGGSVEADLRARLAQAEQSVKSCDVCGNECSTWSGHALKERAEKAERDLAAAQAENVRLREALREFTPEGVPHNGVAWALRDFAKARQEASGKVDGRSLRLVDWAIAIEAALATPPGSRAALREMLTQCAGAVWALAAPSRQMDSEACIAIVSRILSEEGGQS